MFKFDYLIQLKNNRKQTDGFILQELLVSLLLFLSITTFLIVQSSGENKDMAPIEELTTYDLHPITYHFYSDEITNKSELKLQLISMLQARPEEINISYYGKGVQTGDDIINLINNIQYSSNYYGNNLHQYTIDTKKDLKKTEDGAYEVSLYNLKYRTSKREEEYVNKEVLNITNKNIHEEMNEYERVRFIFDYIVDKKEYTYDTYNNGQSAYSFFKNGKGVCHAYALSAARLLDEAGIENHFVFGDTTQNGHTEAHTWNKVRIDGEWYNIDATWADKDDNRDEYFLITDKTLNKTHTERTKEGMPKATSNKYE